MITIPQDVLLVAVDAVRRAMSADETRPHLACLQLDVTPTRLTTAATDGHWLALFAQDGDYGGEAALVVTAESARDLARWLRGRRKIMPKRPRLPRRGPVVLDPDQRIVAGSFGRFALGTYDGVTAVPDIPAAVPVATDSPFAGAIAAPLLRRIARSFEDVYGARWTGLRFRAGRDAAAAVRITASLDGAAGRSLLVVCMPLREEASP